MTYNKILERIEQGFYKIKVKRPKILKCKCEGKAKEKQLKRLQKYTDEKLQKEILFKNDMVNYIIKETNSSKKVAEKIFDFTYLGIKKHKTILDETADLISLIKSLKKENEKKEKNN